MVSSKSKNTIQISKDLLLSRNELAELLHCGVSSVNASEIFPEFAGFRFPLLDKKIY